MRQEFLIIFRCIDYSILTQEVLTRVTAPAGWPLTMAQWKRVDEVRNAETVKRPENRDLPMKSVKVLYQIPCFYGNIPGIKKN